MDVAVFDKSGETDEQDLLDAIDEALSRFPSVKVWNLSLGLDSCCHEREFSDFAAALDERSRQHGVLFVIAAGNYRNLRGWPPPDGLVHDRISPPADAVRALTVGSLAHKTSAATLVAEGDPSPFSRRGPAPGFLVKPELAHYAGNCSAKGDFDQTGVISVNGKGALAELVGTSFSTPLVSTLAGGIWNELDVDPAGAHPVLVKALAMHSALLRRVPDDLRKMHYVGLGVPDEVGAAVGCSQSSATLIMQIPVSASGHFEKRQFPMPSCLVGSKGLRCEVFMTLAHDCPLDQQYGFEYCRSNVDASLGLYRLDKKSGKMRQKREVEPVPSDPGRGFEVDLIEHGYKWSPVKMYYRQFLRGPANEEWRLRLSRLDRAEFKVVGDQMVFLVITIRDLDGKAPVYDEVVRSMNKLGWTVQDLRVRSRTRLQA